MYNIVYTLKQAQDKYGPVVQLIAHFYRVGYRSGRSWCGGPEREGPGQGVRLCGREGSPAHEFAPPADSQSSRSA